MKTVLIVDDHDWFRSEARLMLEAAGYAVIGEAVDGASGIAAARSLRPSIVLLDVRLPDMNGFDAALHIKGCSVVMISSHDASTYRTRLATADALGFLAKADLTAAALDALLERE